jgi:hypothetical protein
VVQPLRGDKKKHEKRFYGSITVTEYLCQVMWVDLSEKLVKIDNIMDYGKLDFDHMY